MKPHWWTNLLLLGGSLFIALGFFEVTARLAVEPSNRSWGRLAGQELPPLELLPELHEDEIDRTLPIGDLVVEGKRITRGDLWGLMRQDPELGWVSQENAISVNGWWQSNNLGARSRTDTARERPAGLRRMIVFGESFTMGSRVRQEESWPYYLGEHAAQLDVVNFAVDGYSMAQSFVRYRRVRDQADHDLVALGFVPREDLIRDINTLRTLIGWSSSTIVPRFRLENGELLLVSPPSRSAQELRDHVDPGGIDRLETHLRLYDSVFFPERYDVPPIIGGLVAYKLPAALWYRHTTRRFNDALMDGDSEALRTTRAIFDTLSREVSERGQRLVLVYIPTKRDISEHRRSPAFRNRWTEIIESCPANAACIDLLPDLSAIEALDEGFDGSHYGPLTNARIAQAVRQSLPEELRELAP